ncbi:hypothetical protein [Desulfovibrio sp. Huiquan2017]|uniref:hypothetical protein n=1 Tax=Desulfovibrio sp. Huiquan2017 TaxID=2816861 RepID=UPI001A92FFCD|nr:hypothetical protein [Desulfovibrio sp. Huiquan2017]
MHTRTEEGRRSAGEGREVHVVMTTNGGTIDGCAGIYEDRGEADGIARELMRLGHDCLVETRALNTVRVRVSGDDIAPVKSSSESDVIDVCNG